MADIVKSWAFVLSNEDTTPPSGAVTKDGNGAIARLGVNSHWHPEALSDGFYDMPLGQALEYAENIFKYDYWAGINGYTIASQLIASKFSDLAFNASVREGTVIIQRAANKLWPLPSPLATDGVCGPLTINRVNVFSSEPETLYCAIMTVGESFYEVLLARHPEKFSAAQEQAWLKRLYVRPPV